MIWNANYKKISRTANALTHPAQGKESAANVFLIISRTMNCLLAHSTKNLRRPMTALLTTLPRW